MSPSNEAHPREDYVDLGPEASFTTIPASLSVAEEPCFLVRNKQGEYLLLSAVCPHMGSEVLDWDNCFMCPHHGWRFEKTEGVCVNGPNARMHSYPVTVRDGRLFADMSAD